MTLKQYLTEYGKSHRNPTNQKIHFVCVPAILISTLALGWLLNLGLVLDTPWARWINLATVGGLLTIPFYLRMGARALLAMTGFFALALGCILAVESSGLPLWAVAAAVWIAAWAVQLIGHNIEGAKPSFSDDMKFLLIGPLFVLDEWGVNLGTHQSP
ncbi:MAG: Mpo1-like protein [Pseudomonadota bacterium]